MPHGVCGHRPHMASSRCRKGNAASWRLEADCPHPCALALCGTIAFASAPLSSQKPGMAYKQANLTFHRYPFTSSLAPHFTFMVFLMYMVVCLCVCLCSTGLPGTHGGQKRALDPLEPDLQIAVKPRRQVLCKSSTCS